MFFVISYEHLGFMLHLLLFNESVLHYSNIMCVTVMVFSACMNDSIYQYLLLLVVKLLVMHFDSSCGFLFTYGGYN